MAKKQKEPLFKRFLKKLHNPPNWVALIMYATTLVVCPLAVLTILMGYGHGVLAVVAYIVCGLIFLYTVYMAIASLYRLRKRLMNVADKYTFTRNLRKNYEFRTIVFGACTLLFNIGYTVFLCVMAVRTRSVWYGALAVYSILLVAARGGVLIQNHKDERKYKNDNVRLQKAKAGGYRYCGVMILVLTLALAVSVVEMVVKGEGFRVPKFAIVLFALFAVYRIAMAAYNIVKAKKYDDFAVRASRNINMTSALVSALTLLTAVFAVYPPSFNPSVINAVAGILVCGYIVGLGIYMIINSVRFEKRLLEKENTQEIPLDTSGYNRDGYNEEYGKE